MDPILYLTSMPGFYDKLGAPSMITDWAINYWEQAGLPANKLVVGLAVFGRAMELIDKDNTKMGAPIKGAASAGKWTREKGFWAYYEICTKLAPGGFTSEWESESRVPYAYGPAPWGGVQEWVGYDNKESLTEKVNYVKAKGYRGVMIWALDLDDFNGQRCGMGKYPLLQHINDLLVGNTLPSSIKPTPSTTTATAPTTPYTGTTPTTPEYTGPTTPEPENCGEVCVGKADGDYGYPKDNTKYCQCYNNGQWTLRECAAGTVWCPSQKYCGWPSEKGC